MNRERGLSTVWIVVLVVLIVIVAAVSVMVAMVAVMAPTLTSKGHEHQCMNNLKQIGGLLLMLEAQGKLKPLSGEAFLLQVAMHLRDDDLDLFLCPGIEHTGGDRPGSQAFAERYRTGKLTSGNLESLTSYTGPNFEDFPPQGRKPRLWACDRCDGGESPHDGIAVLWSTGKVEFLSVDDLVGHEAGGKIIVGPNSPDPRLGMMAR